LIRPVTAFITFKNEKGYNRARQLQPKIKCFKEISIECWKDAPFSLKSATEPTDIIWENRHFTRFDRIKRTTIVFIISGLILTASFVLIFWLKTKIGKLTEGSGDIKCEDVEKIFDNY
jgi:hypothetical protein